MSELSETLRLLQMLHMMEQMERSGRHDSTSSSASGGESGSGSANKQLRSDYVMVAAIDFGTTFSGYAFSFKNDPDDVRMNKNWGANLGFGSYKTPTCVLVDGRKKFVAFGYQAQSKYANLVEESDQDHMYFDRFKMKLHNNKNLSRTTNITASDGKREMPALDIFAMALKYLKDHLLEAVSALPESDKGGSKLEYIRWVLTVPAIWSDPSKQFMREAAKQAGLIDDVDSGQLLIALEPEAASLYCRSIEINQFVEKSRKTNLTFNAGVKYLVIDAGGGTLDVTAHEIQRDKTVKELYYATGGALGGTRVDEEFVKLMEKIFGKDFIDAFKQKHASLWLQMICDFESKKKAVSNDRSASTNIEVLWGFASAFNEIKGKDVGKAVSQCGVRGVKFSNGKIQITADLARELFKPVVDGIVAHIRDLMRKPDLRGIEYFFLVGGFSESEMVQNAIFKAFDDVTVLVPDESSLAVMKGAVAFGHEPGTISSRRAKLAYGVEHLADYDPSEHRSDKRCEIEGRVKCRDLFEIYINAGDEVEHDFSKTVQFRPAKAQQQGADVEIYSANRSDVKYITDRGCEKLGQVHVQWPGSGLDRQLQITMSFGGTEIHVQAKSYPGGHSAATKIDFLSH